MVEKLKAMTDEEIINFINKIVTDNDDLEIKDLKAILAEISGRKMEVPVMAGRQSILSRIRLKNRRSSTTVKCIVLATLVVCTMALLVLRVAILDAQKEEEALRTKAATLEQENKELNEDISQLGTVESIKKIAAKILGLVDPDTVVFLPE